MIRSRKKRKKLSDGFEIKAFKNTYSIQVMHFNLFGRYYSNKKQYKIESDYHYERNNQLK